jgi:hypothetical protein
MIFSFERQRAGPRALALAHRQSFSIFFVSFLPHGHLRLPQFIFSFNKFIFIISKTSSPTSIKYNIFSNLKLSKTYLFLYLSEIKFQISLPKSLHQHHRPGCPTSSLTMRYLMLELKSLKNCIAPAIKNHDRLPPHEVSRTRRLTIDPI